MAEDFVVENTTPRRVLISGLDGSSLSMAPLEQRQMTREELEPFDADQLSRGGDIRVTPVEGHDLADVVPGMLVWAVILYLIIGVNVQKLWFWVLVPVVLLVGALIATVWFSRGRQEVTRGVRQSISLALVVLIGVGLPLAAVWYSTDIRTAAGLTPSFDRLDEPGVAVIAFGRLLQVVFIAVASLLPALMFFLFDREQLGTQRDRFIRHVFAFDPTLNGLGDLEAKYGRQMAEVYGPPKRVDKARLVGGRRSPVVMATLFVTLGWTLTLLNRDVLAVIVEGGVVEFLDLDYLELFTPDASVITFGFLGAYLFTLQLILRGYLRGDLRAKAYSQVSVRILVVVILSWTLGALFDETSPMLYVIAFAVGIVPDIALRRLQEMLRERGWLASTDRLVEQAPLTLLEGIDLYDRSRLTGEGIGNVEGLAHADIVELVLQTRIPMTQLVDWLDQAVLFLHTSPAEIDEDGGVTLRDRLREYGIRTATELEHARDAAAGRGGDDELRITLAALAGEDAATRPLRLQVVLDAMAQAEWMENLRHWRNPSTPTATLHLMAPRSTPLPGPEEAAEAPQVDEPQAAAVDD